MFNDMPWPDADFLKVTIERDLLIGKRFDENPILWDVLDMIARHREDGSCPFSHCSVLIRALLAVQMTCWSSGPSCTDDSRLNQDDLDTTQKLITLLAASELLPSHPFKDVPSVLPYLSPWEMSVILNEVWRLLRDSSNNDVVLTNPMAIKPYLERFRVILSFKKPGPEFVDIFKGILSD